MERVYSKIDGVEINLYTCLTVSSRINGAQGNLYICLSTIDSKTVSKNGLEPLLMVLSTCYSNALWAIST